MIASIGNEGYDTSTIRPYVIVPAELPFVVTVSAVGPVFPHHGLKNHQHYH